MWRQIRNVVVLSELNLDDIGELSVFDVTQDLGAIFPLDRFQPLLKQGGNWSLEGFVRVDEFT